MSTDFQLHLQKIGNSHYQGVKEDFLKRIIKECKEAAVYKNFCPITIPSLYYKKLSEDEEVINFLNTHFGDNWYFVEPHLVPSVLKSDTVPGRLSVYW